jgi:predicted Zn-dependent protease
MLRFVPWAILLLAGCASQRPLFAVKEHGAEAFAAGDYETALAAYTEYVGRRPGDDTVQIELARTLIAVGQPAKAVEHAWIAYDQEPRNDAYADVLARAMHDAGQTDALFKFLRARTTELGRVDDYLRLAHYTALNGDADGALTAYLTAARLDKGRTVGPQLALADFYLSVGDRAKAVERLRMVLFLDPKHAAASQKLRDLGEIPGPSLALPPEESTDRP